MKKTKYDGISVNKYTASLGDMSANKEDKCYCYTPDTCLKKGLMDLYKCGGIPIYISMPHFYDSDKSYLEGIEGLNPNQEDHEISILFEQVRYKNFVSTAYFVIQNNSLIKVVQNAPLFCDLVLRVFSDYANLII